MVRATLRNLAVAAVAAGLLGATPAAAVTLVNSCRDLDKAGETYVLTIDVSIAAGSCFRVLATRITLDLAGHSVSGTSPDAAHGVEAINSPVLVVKNGTIQNFNGAGIQLQSSPRSTIRSVVVADNYEGIVTFGEAVGSSLFKDCTIRGNQTFGIRLIDGPGHQVEGCLIENNGHGFPLSNGILSFGPALVTRNIVRNSGLGGIAFFDAGTVTHNTVTGNAGAGIEVGPRSLVTNNMSTDNEGDGIVVGARSTVNFNTANENDGDGIQAVCPSTILHNQALGNGGLPINTIGQGCVQNGNVIDSNPT